MAVKYGKMRKSDLVLDMSPEAKIGQLSEKFGISFLIGAVFEAAAKGSKDWAEVEPEISPVDWLALETLLVQTGIKLPADLNSAYPDGLPYIPELDMPSGVFKAVDINNGCWNTGKVTIDELRQNMSDISGIEAKPQRKTLANYIRFGLRKERAEIRVQNGSTYVLDLQALGFISFDTAHKILSLGYNDMTGFLSETVLQDWPRSLRKGESEITSLGNLLPNLTDRGFVAAGQNLPSDIRGRQLELF